MVAPGKDGYYIKREPMMPDAISKMVVHTVRQNERDRRDKIDSKTINSAILSINGNGNRQGNGQDASKRKGIFYG